MYVFTLNDSGSVVVVVHSLFIVVPIVLWGDYSRSCFVVHYLVSFLIFQSHRWGRELVALL